MMDGQELCIVLRAVNYRDNDRILTLFSRAEGRISAQATGARRIKSGLAPAAQPFCCAEYEFYKRGERRYIKNALIKEKFFAIQNDYAKYTSACAMLELADRMLDHAEEWDRLFVRLINTLYALEKDRIGAQAALAYFLVHAIDIMGIFPALDFCAACGRPIENAARWSAAQGGAVCGVCGAYGKAIPEDIPKYFAVLRRVRPEAAGEMVGEAPARMLIGIAGEYLDVAGDIRVKAIKYTEQ